MAVAVAVVTGKCPLALPSSYPSLKSPHGPLNPLLLPLLVYRRRIAVLHATGALASSCSPQGCDPSPPRLPHPDPAHCALPSHLGHDQARSGLILPSPCAQVISNLTIAFTHRLRRDGRSNGTAILRRSSTTPFNNQASTLPAIDNLLNASANEPQPPSASPFASAQEIPSSKYSRDDLLDVGKMTDPGNVDLQALFMSSFSPSGHVNGQNTRGWGKPNDAHAHNDPSVCWDQDGELGPLGNQDMSVEEKEVGTLVIRKFSPDPRDFA